MVKNTTKLNNNSFLERVNNLYNNKYEYKDLNYINNRTKITIFCKEHDYTFVKRADEHLNGSKCKYCSLEERKNKEKIKSYRKKKYTKDEWLQKLNNVHNNFYDYSLNEDIHSQTILKIICPNHGIFEQDITAHYYQHKGCYKCGKERQKQSLTHNNKEWFAISNNIHNNKYTYNNFNYINSRKKSFITCLEHGDFLMSMNDHISSKAGCPKCNTSIGELEIERILIERNIKFEAQKIFNECKYKSVLRFDFYLIDYNICIEYDGIQHFKINEYFGGEEAYKERIIKDYIKDEYCKKNNIKLIRIKYNEDIKEKLSFLDINIISKNRHLNNLNEIENFLILKDISYIKEKDIFYLNNKTLEIRYVDSENHKIDYEKRFGIKGINPNYFINITKKNKENGIRTIWIKDWEIEEFKNIVNIDNHELINYKRKWNVLQSYIKTATGKIENRIYARDCIIKELSNKEIKPFLEENSFYGYRNANVNLGLFLNKDKYNLKKDTLLMVYTFGHPFFSKGLYDVEVIRVATKLNYQVIGGASKLLHYFLLNYPTLNINNKIINVNTIVFIVDADHNDAKSLDSLGFTFVSHKGNGFMNIETSTGKVHHRQPRKHKEIMNKIANGEMYSVANAGSIIYTINRNEYLEKMKK